MNKGLWVGAGVVVLVRVVGGGVLLLRNANPKSQIPNPKVETVVAPTTAPAVEAKGETKIFVVEGSSFKFVPAVIKVKKDDNVQITFKNSGGLHDFTIDELDVKTNQIGEGEEEEVEFVADETGTFAYYCSVDGHRQLGMVGKLIIE